MTSQQLLYFKAVIDCGSFSKAAERLYVSQPLLTRTIKALEAELDVHLIDRNSKHFHVTNAGAVLYEHSHRLLSDLDNIHRAVHDTRVTDGGEVRLSIPAVLLDMYFAPLCLAFQEKHPYINISTIECASYAVFDSLLHHSTDLGMVMLPLSPDPVMEKLAISQVLTDQVGLVMRRDHPLAGAEQLDIRCIRNERIVTFGEDATVYKELVKLCERYAFTPQVTHKCLTTNFISAMISHSNYIGVLPMPLIRHILTDDMVSATLEQDFPWRIALLHCLDAYQSRAAKAMEDFIIDYFAQNYTHDLPLQA